MKNRNFDYSVDSGSANLEFMKQALNYNSFLTSLLKKNLTKKSKILDFGAGNGEFAMRLVRDGFKVDVLEVEKKLASQLKGMGLKTYSSLDEVENLSYSSIYSLNVLEHIENDLLALESIYEKLERNGTLVLYLPAFDALFSKMDSRVGHFRRYKKSTLGKILVEAGFKIEKMHYVDFLGFFVTIAYKFFPGRDGTVSITALRFYDFCIFPMNYVFDKFFGQICGKNLVAVVRKVPNE